MTSARLKFPGVIAILLAAMVVLSACMGGSAPNGSQSPSFSPGSGPDATVTSDNPIPQGFEDKDPVELNIHVWYTSPSIQATIDLFQQTYPWITVKLNKSISGAIINNIIAGEKSDIVFLDAGLSQWIAGGNDLLEELTPYIEKDERIRNAKLPEGYMDMFKLGDKQYTMPFTDIPMWIVINKDMLSDYGQEMPPLDWTYDDMLALAKVVADPSANIWGMYGTSWLTDIMTVANGSAANFRLMGKDHLESVADTPEVLADLQWLQDLTLKWNVVPTEEQADENGIPGDTSAAFIKGNILMAAVADWDLQRLITRAEFDWDVLPFPVGRQKQVTMHQVGPMAMTKASVNKEEAFLFMSFLFSEEAQKVMIENGSAAWVLSPELDAYYDQVEIWGDKNREVVKMSAKMGHYTSDSLVMNLRDYQDSVFARIDVIMRNGGNFSEVIPYVEEYNRKIAEIRKEIGF